MTERCVAVRSDGGRCESVIVLESGYCFAHDPDREADRRRARASGGSATSNVAKLRRHLEPSHLGPVFSTLVEALDQVHAGSLSPARGSSMASIARALCAVLEVGELEERLTALEIGRTG
jgi:hypothetical protein